MNKSNFDLTLPKTFFAEYKPATDLERRFLLRRNFAIKAIFANTIISKQA
jgi:hypothetical protein